MSGTWKVPFSSPLNLRTAFLPTFQMSSVVSVQIGSYFARNVLRELARCLAMFPNLHTLKLDLSIDGLDRAITYGFSPYKSFPQIRSVIMPTACYDLLKYCPGVRYVYNVRQKVLSDHDAFILADFCPLIENICFQIPSTVELLPSLLPRVQDMLTFVTYSCICHFSRDNFLISRTLRYSSLTHITRPSSRYGFFFLVHCSTTIICPRFIWIPSSRIFVIWKLSGWKCIASTWRTARRSYHKWKKPWSAFVGINRRELFFFTTKPRSSSPHRRGRPEFHY